MSEIIHGILKQLEVAISAQITSANERLHLLEARHTKLLDGLGALIGQAASNDNPPDIEAADIAATLDHEVIDRQSRQKVPDQVFLDALSTEWSTPSVILERLRGAGINIVEGTVYNRMRKLAHAHADTIETASGPERWRLRAPIRLKRKHADKNLKPVGEVASAAPPPANDISPRVLTNVRALVAAESLPQRTYLPDLRHGDCFETMKSLDDSSIDLILTDPPYATTGLEIDPVIDLAALWIEYRRILKPKATVVMFGSQPFTSRLVCSAPDLFKYDLVWLKHCPTGGLQARNRPMKQHEDILVFSNGTTVQSQRSSRRATYNALGQISAGMKTVSRGKHSQYLRDVTHHPGREYEGTTNNPRTTLICPKDRGNVHPFQKPVALLEYLIRTYSDEGDVVLDSFAGSGSTCVAAMNSGRRSIGVEMDRRYFEVAEQRISNLIPALAA